METPKTIGMLIEYEVRKQGKSIVEFAKSINCTRTNVYNIFKRNSISIIQLKAISKILKRNFFKDLAEDIDLINMPSNNCNEDKEKHKAVSRFFEIVPNILESMGKSTSIIFAKDDALPDFAIKPYYITFTILDSLESKLSNPCLKISRCKKNDVEFCINETTGTVSLNIIINNKTEDEWHETLSFVFENYPKIEKMNNQIYKS